MLATPIIEYHFPFSPQLHRTRPRYAPEYGGDGLTCTSIFDYRSTVHRLTDACPFAPARKLTPLLPSNRGGD